MYITSHAEEHADGGERKGEPRLGDLSLSLSLYIYINKYIYI